MRTLSQRRLRVLYTMKRSRISPPPSKRQKLSTDSISSFSASSFRIFSWNINGIQPFLPASSAPITSYFKPANDQPKSTPKHLPKNSLRGFLSRHNWPEVLFLQELKISPKDTKTVVTLQNAINTPLNIDDILSPETTYTLDVCLPRDKYNATAFGGKLYGVATLLRSDFANQRVERVREVGWDGEGRVLIVETHKYTLINIYAVNGTSSPYFSPTTGAAAGTRHDRKLAFHSLLRDECLSLEKRGLGVVVAGDVNVARGLPDGHPNLRTWPAQHCLNRADFNIKFFSQEDNDRAKAYVGKDTKKREGECLDAVDVFRAIHGTERRYTYYPRNKPWGTSCDRVDMVFVSKPMLDAGDVLETGILDTPQERGPSDHVPLWVTIKIE